MWAVGTDQTDRKVRVLERDRVVDRAHPDLTRGSRPEPAHRIIADGVGQVRASGYAGTAPNLNSFDVPYVLHWTGTAWVMTKIPNVDTKLGNVGGEGSLLNGIQVLSPTDAWVVGATVGLNEVTRTDLRPI